MTVKSFRASMQVGLGEAIERLVRLDGALKAGIANDEQKAERRLLFEALNEISIDLGFDCDGDGVPDTAMEVFAASASTSCCRLLPLEAAKRTKARQVVSKPRRTSRRS
ncbi:hypothetical protein CMI47_10555 [Candidatus Pacearchaeota archaeon]|nr:hypothetical protein [Candidatus Pacearchaeota archaeon]|tara:strand:- start:2540 stop:2866 length:327 start_codon:yes stop_codon:yes gene_type:complete